MTTADELLCEGLTPLTGTCFSGVLLPTESFLWVCHLWNWLGGALVCSEASHWVCWFWDLLGGALVQAKFSHCQCLIQHHLMGATE